MPRNVYLGHFVDAPDDLAIVTATSFLDAIDWCDSVGQPDDGSFDGIIDPMVVRFRAKAYREPSEMPEEDGDFWEYVQLHSHEAGAIALAGEDLDRMMQRIVTNASTIGDDLMRAYGSYCDQCESRHFDDQACKLHIESDAGTRAHFVKVNDDPTDIALVITNATRIKDIMALASAAGSNPKYLQEVDSEVLFNIQLHKDGTSESVPEYCCLTEDFEMLTEWFEELAQAGAVEEQDF